MSAIETYLYWQVNLVAFRVHSRFKPLMTFQCQTTLCVVLELAQKEEAYNSAVYKKSIFTFYRDCTNNTKIKIAKLEVINYMQRIY